MVVSGNKPLPEPMLTRCVTIHRCIAIHWYFVTICIDYRNGRPSVLRFTRNYICTAILSIFKYFAPSDALQWKGLIKQYLLFFKSSVLPKNLHGSSGISPMGFIYSIQICEISHQTFGPGHRKYLMCPMIFVNTESRFGSYSDSCSSRFSIHW